LDITFNSTTMSADTKQGHIPKQYPYVHYLQQENKY